MLRGLPGSHIGEGKTFRKKLNIGDIGEQKTVAYLNAFSRDSCDRVVRDSNTLVLIKISKYSKT